MMLERKPPARVLIVDDHPLFRYGLAELLGRESGIEVSGQVGEAAAAWRELERSPPDLMIIDLRLNESEGLDLLKSVHARYPEVRLLVLSMCDEKEYAEWALRAGAMGYVEKHESPDVVLQAVHEVLADSVFLSPAMRERLLRQFVGRRGGARAAPPAGELVPQRLSTRELQVLDLLGQGLSTPDIARRLQLSLKTVQSHRERLKTKLRVRTGAELVHYAITRQFASAASRGKRKDRPPRR